MLQPLSTEVVQRLRSGVAITSVSHCVEELVINAIDAKATCVAVRLNLPFFKIQVVDNGNGINSSQMEFVGVRYATSKCHSIDDLHNLKYGGFRGEALASLKDVSSILSIESRSAKSKETHCKIFTHGRPPKVQKASTNRPSKGTTVTIHDFMYNMPVRKQCISNSLDIEDCRKVLEKLALIYPEVSFSLRDDAIGEICLETKRCSSSKSAFMYLFGQEKANSLKEITIAKNVYNVSGFISTEGHISKELQLAYVNKRYVHRTKLQKLVSAILKKYLFSRSKSLSKDNIFSSLAISPSKSQTRYAIFILNITCPYDEYDIILEPRKTLVEFANWENILKILEEAVFHFLKNNELWCEKESTIELSVDKNSTQNISDNISNFPADLGKDITTQDNKHGLFSIPAKRGVSKTHDNLSISPLKKLKFPPHLKKILNEEPIQNDLNKKSNKIFEPLEKRVVSNLISKFRKTSIPINSKIGISALNNFKIPETDVCLQEISEILSKNGKKITEKSQQTQTDPLSCLKKFQYTTDKKSNFEIKQKHEATQTGKHVSINPVAEEIHVPIHKSKYTFGTESDFESLKHLNHLKKNHTKFYNINNFKKHPQISAVSYDCGLVNKHMVANEVEVSSSINESIIYKNNAQHELPHRMSLHKSKNTEECAIQPDTHLCEQNIIQNNVKLSPLETLHKKKEKLKHHKLSFEIHRSPVVRNKSKKLIHRYSQLRYLKNRSISNFTKRISSNESANHLYLKRNIHQRRKTSPNISTYNYSHPSQITCKNSPFKPSTSLFLQYNIDDLVKQGRSIIESSPDSIKCNVSKNESEISLSEETFLSHRSLDNPKWESFLHTCTTEQLLNIKLNKSDSLKSDSEFNFSYGDRSHLSTSVLKSPPSQELQNFSCKEISFKSSGHNESRNSFWKEVADSPPSPYYDNKESPNLSAMESHLNIRRTSLNLSNSPQDIERLKDNMFPLHAAQDDNESLKESDDMNDHSCEIYKGINIFNKHNNLPVIEPQNNRTTLPTLQSSITLNEVDVPISLNSEQISQDVEISKNSNSRIKIDPVSPRTKHFTKLSENFNFNTLPNYISEIPKFQNASKELLVEGTEVEDLFSNWKNPMFQRSLTEVEPANCSAILQNSMTMYGVLNSYRFTKKAFSNIQVIGQVDNKFIACLIKDVNEELKDKQILVLFDQHAVHERIRLEELMAAFYENSQSKQALSTELSPSLEINLNQSESRLVNTYSSYLKRMGISILCRDNDSKLEVVSVPGCLIDRANNELKCNRILALSSLIETIIKEWIVLLEETRNPVTVLPKTLIGILNSQACKGAVKFGDPLDLQQCTSLLESLSTCNLPFQCAHGRPSLAPLLDLEKVNFCTKRHNPRLSKLKEIMNENHII